MVSIINTGSAPQNLRPGIHEFFGTAYEMYATEYDKLFDIKVAEKKAYEEDVTISGLGLATVKPQGSAVEYDSGNQLFSTRYTHVQYGSGFQITEEAMDDGVAIKLAEVFAKSLKLSMLRTRETVSAGTYVNAFSSSFQMDGGDGVQLCSNAHPTVAGNQSNVPATIGALSEATIEQGIIDIQAYVDNRGQKIMVIPRSLIVPPALQFTAERILASPLRSGTNDNDINALRSLGMIPDGVHVNHYLTSTSNWFLRTNQDGLQFFNRKDITLSDDNVFDSENMKFKGLMRFSVGWSDFRAIYGVNA